VRHFSNRFGSQNQPFLGFADQIAQLLGGDGRRNAEGWCQAHCPLHGDSRPSLSLKDGPHGLIAKCFAGCPSAEIKQHILGLLKSGTELPPPVLQESQGNTRIDLMRIAARIWHESVPLQGTLSQRYLQGRGINNLTPETLRHHPAVFHKESNSYGPAMIAVVQDVHGNAVGIHRTWLDPLTGGKAKFDPPRKSLCSIKGHAVHLIETGADPGTVYVSEGIENGLSYARIIELGGGEPVSVWAALSAPGIASLGVLDHIDEIVVLCDRDEVSVRAANKLARRVRRQHVAIRTPLSDPPHKPNDFNDMLMLVTHR
jgi:hypothetical protein